MTATRPWRLAKMTKAQGAYFILQGGSGKARISLSLGYVDAAAAERALDLIRREEEQGVSDRVLAKYEADRSRAVAYLTDDSGDVDLGDRDWSRVSLRRYVDESGYVEWRASQITSWPTERGFLERVLRDLGGMRMRDVDSHAFADFLDDLTVERATRRRGEPASGSYKAKCRAALHAVMKRAERRRHIERAPDLVQFQVKGSTKRVTEAVVPLDLEELAALMNASLPKHRAMWAVQGGMGLRPSELVRVRWGDVDLETGTLAVRGTKTDASAAVVALTPLAAKELVRWRAVAKPAPLPGSVVFPARRDGTPYEGSNGYKSALATAARKAGIKRGITPYVFRASFATIAWALGIEKDAAIRIGRWTDSAMFDRVYCRPRPAELASKLKAFDLPTVNEESAK